MHSQSKLLDDVAVTAITRAIIERARMQQLLPRGHCNAQQAGALCASRSTAPDTTIEHHHHPAPPTSGSFKLWHSPGLRAEPKLFHWPHVRPPHHHKIMFQISFDFMTKYPCWKVQNLQYKFWIEKALPWYFSKNSSILKALPWYFSKNSSILKAIASGQFFALGVS